MPVSWEIRNRVRRPRDGGCLHGGGGFGFIDVLNASITTRYKILQQPRTYCQTLSGVLFAGSRTGHPGR
jgi:hypothetical protein